jgi:hypothetical protein
VAKYYVWIISMPALTVKGTIFMPSLWTSLIMSGVVKWENPPLDDKGMRNVPVGDKMSACIAWAACAICLDSDGPGNESRRRPANQEEVELSGVKALSLDSDRLTDKLIIPIIHVLVYESRSWNFIVQILHLPVRKQRERKRNTKTFIATRVRQSKLWYWQGS